MTIVEVSQEWGPQGTPGRSIHTGFGAPANNVGQLGDVYLDITDAHVIAGYGPKTSDGWPAEPFVTASPDETAATISALVTAAVADKVDKTHYAAVQRIVGNPTDVVIAGTDYATAHARGIELGYLDVITTFDEGAACVVDGVAYWVSGYARWSASDQSGGGLGGTPDNDYLPYILRYDLVNDVWLPSVPVPAPNGAPVDAPFDPETESLNSGFDAGADLETGNAATFVHWTGGAYVIPNGGYLRRTSGLHQPSPQPEGTYVAVLPGGLNTVLPAGMHYISNVTHNRLVRRARSAPLVGWGFEGGYYGAIGTKLYFGGGDSNLYDDGSGSGEWDSGLGRQLVSYDTVTHEFETLAVKPHGFDYSGFGVADGKLYTVGNLPGQGFYVEVYDPDTGTWASTHTNVDTTLYDIFQGIQVGRFLYWPDAGIKLNLDADPTTVEAWISLPDVNAVFSGPSSVSFDSDAGVALKDGLIHYFTASGETTFHLTLDPVDDTWAIVNDGVGAARFYFAAVLTSVGDWRFIGGDTDVQGEVHLIDPVVTQHGVFLSDYVAEQLLPYVVANVPSDLAGSVGNTAKVLASASQSNNQMLMDQWGSMPDGWVPSSDHTHVDLPDGFYVYVAKILSDADEPFWVFGPNGETFYSVTTHDPWGSPSFHVANCVGRLALPFRASGNDYRFPLQFQVLNCDTVNAHSFHIDSVVVAKIR